MSKFHYLKKLAVVTSAVFAMVLAINGPSEAAGGGHGGGFSGGHEGGHPAFEGHGFEGHHGFDGHFDGHRGFDGRFRGGFVYPSYGYAPYYGEYPAYDAPSYYWYCPSYGAYYPSVESCPSAWQPVPAS